MGEGACDALALLAAGVPRVVALCVGQGGRWDGDDIYKNPQPLWPLFSSLGMIPYQLHRGLQLAAHEGIVFVVVGFCQSGACLFGVW